MVEPRQDGNRSTPMFAIRKDADSAQALDVTPQHARDVLRQLTQHLDAVEACIERYSA